MDLTLEQKRKEFAESVSPDYSVDNEEETRKWLSKGKLDKRCIICPKELVLLEEKRQKPKDFNRPEGFYFDPATDDFFEIVNNVIE